MKNIIKILFPIVILIVGCTKDYLDINKDPNNPDVAKLDFMLTNAEWGIGDNLSINSGLSNFAAVYMHQVTMREDPDQYGVTGNSFYTNAPWNNLYAGPLQDLELIIKTGEAEGNLVYAGVAKILKAYTFSQLVDVYGDVPYSEAFKQAEGLYYPQYDDDELIYESLLNLLDDAIADINNPDAENFNVPGGDDVIFGGDTDKWIRTANTIKLKLLTQTRLVWDVNARINELIAGDQLIEDFNFELPYGLSKSPDNRNPGSAEYEATQRSFYISPWFYRIMKGQNEDIFTDIEDPRIPYYFYNQLAPGQATREGNKTEYRDGGFVSIYFGSIGKNRDHSTDGSMTVLGIYPVGGRFDSDDHKKVTGMVCTGAAPYRFITYADRLYLEAELVNVGIVTGDARAILEDAISESFVLVDHVVALTQPDKAEEEGQEIDSDIPTFSKTLADTGYIQAVIEEFDAADEAKQLEIIMTQKWIASFGSSVDQWTDYRRTGYPVVFDPNNEEHAPGGFVVSPEPPAVGDDPAIPVQLINLTPLSLPWGQDDLGKNPNAPDQKNPATYSVFWDN